MGGTTHIRGVSLKRKYIASYLYIARKGEFNKNNTHARAHPRARTRAHHLLPLSVRMEQKHGPIILRNIFVCGGGRNFLLRKPIKKNRSEIKNKTQDRFRHRHAISATVPRSRKGTFHCT